MLEARVARVRRVPRVVRVQMTFVIGLQKNVINLVTCSEPWETA
jgi:hypothetical protein